MIDTNEGVCMTCGNEARATPENEGYSNCCNDRIAYGEEIASVLRDLEELGEYEGAPEL